MYFLWVVFVLSLILPAFGGEKEYSQFRKIFAKYIELRALDDELSFLKNQKNVVESQIENTQNQILAKRRDLNQGFLIKYENLSESEILAISTIEKCIEKKICVADEKADLAKLFPESKGISPLEWQGIMEIFGNKAQQKFLSETFAIATEENSAVINSNKLVGKSEKILFLDNSLRKLSLIEGGALSELKPYLNAINPTEIVASLKAEGFDAELLSLSPFAKFDDQVEELYRILQNREEHFNLVSAGETSAIVLRALDLYPSLRSLPSIKKWINMNGRLYGFSSSFLESIKGRTPASKQTISPLVDSEENIKKELHSLNKESRLAEPVLGPGFPIINLISGSKGNRFPNNLRESIVTKGNTLWTKSEDANSNAGKIIQISISDPIAP